MTAEAEHHIPDSPIDKYALSFPQISDDPGIVLARFGVPAQPALVVVSPNGDAQVLLGAVDDENLQSVLTEASAGWVGWWD